MGSGFFSRKTNHKKRLKVNHWGTEHYHLAVTSPPGRGRSLLSTNAAAQWLIAGDVGLQAFPALKDFFGGRCSSFFCDSLAFCFKGPFCWIRPNPKNKLWKVFGIVGCFFMNKELESVLKPTKHKTLIFKVVWFPHIKVLQCPTTVKIGLPFLKGRFPLASKDTAARAPTNWCLLVCSFLKLAEPPQIFKIPGNLSRPLPLQGQRNLFP